MELDVHLVVCEKCNSTIRVEGADSRDDAIEKAEQKKKIKDCNCKGECDPIFVWAFLYDEIKHQLPKT